MPLNRIICTLQRLHSCNTATMTPMVELCKNSPPCMRQRHAPSTARQKMFSWEFVIGCDHNMRPIYSSRCLAEFHYHTTHFPSLSMYTPSFILIDLILHRLDFYGRCSNFGAILEPREQHDSANCPRMPASSNAPSLFWRNLVQARPSSRGSAHR
jgi:hypothetical protein